MHAVPCDRGSILEAIYSLPVVFKLGGHVSLLQLVRETGYPDQQAGIGVDEIRSGLANREGIIAAWLEHSRDKGADWGWYFQGPHQGFYLAGSRSRSLEGPINTRDAALFVEYLKIGQSSNSFIAQETNPHVHQYHPPAPRPQSDPRESLPRVPRTRCPEQMDSA